MTARSRPHSIITYPGKKFKTKPRLRDPTSVPNLPELEIRELYSPLYLDFRSERSDLLANPKVLFVSLSITNRSAKTAVLSVTARNPTESIIRENEMIMTVLLPNFSINHPLGILPINPAKV